jgi:hypothetical protein
MSFRNSIVTGLSSIVKTSLDGSQPTKYITNIYDNVFTVSKHFSQIQDYPAITITPGPESFEYLPSGMRWNFLRVYIRAYVKDEYEPNAKLELLIEDIKNLIDEFDTFTYTVSKPDGTTLTLSTTQSTLEEISTDEGLLAPLGIGELIITIRYSQDTRLV